jgi:hypothetical protein
MQYVIYKVTSISGKSYIGLTSKTIEWRWNNHKATWANQLKKGKHYNCPKLYKAFEKYNPYVDGNWTIEVIDIAESRNKAVQLEEDYISTYNTLNEGYNSHPGGLYSNGIKGVKQTPEHIAKRFASPRTHTEETKLKQSESRKKMFETPAGILLKEKLREHGRKTKGRKKGPCSQTVKDAVSKANAKSYSISFPDGSVHIIIGIGKFCKEHNLTAQTLMNTLPGGKWKQHKGYKLLSRL